MSRRRLARTKFRCNSVAEWEEWGEWVWEEVVVVEMDLGLVAEMTTGVTTKEVVGETTVGDGATKAIMALLTRVGQEAITRVVMATKAHGKVVPPTTKDGTTRPTKDGAHRQATMVVPQTTGDKALVILETTMDRAMVVDP